MLRFGALLASCAASASAAASQTLSVAEWGAMFGAADGFDSDAALADAQLQQAAASEGPMAYVVTARDANGASTRALRELVGDAAAVTHVGASAAYKAPLTPAMRDALLADSTGTWASVVAIPAPLKVVPQMRDAVAALAPTDAVVLHVDLVGPLDSSALAAAVAEELKLVAPEAVVAGQGADTRELAVENVPALHAMAVAKLVAAHAEVMSVSPRLAVVASNHFAEWLVQSSESDELPFWDEGIDGTGEIVGFADTGIDLDHCMFAADDDDAAFEFNVFDESQRKVVLYSTYVDNSDEESGGGHGTHVAGTIAGQDISGDEYNDGMGHGAKLAFMDIADPHGNLYVPSNLATGMFPVTHDVGAAVHSESWGTETDIYDTYSMRVDEFSYDNDDFIVAIAAGNSGEDGERTIGSPATAKNCITVGAGLNAADSWSSKYPDDTWNEDSVAFFSSQGPGPDGRMLPDVMAAGFYLSSAKSGTSCDTVKYAGTSMATPAVAGSAAMVRQYFKDGHYADRPEGFTPSGALVKAVLVASGQEMLLMQTPTYDYVELDGGYPSNQQGYGRVVLATALPLPDSAADLSLFAVGEAFSDANRLHEGDTDTYDFDLPAGSSGTLKATLVWTDMPADTSSAAQLVNDLDLTVSDAEARATYYSNGGSGYDRTNNVEQVVVEYSGATSLTVRVQAHNVEDPDGQRYALVVTSGAGNTLVRASSQKAATASSDDDIAVVAFIGVGAALLVMGVAMHQRSKAAEAQYQQAPTSDDGDHGTFGDSFAVPSAVDGSTGVAEGSS